MGRPVYPHELSDSDFSWLINSYRENNPHAVLVESSCLPLVLIKGESIAQFSDEIPDGATPPIVDDSELDLIDRSEKE